MADDMNIPYFDYHRDECPCYLDDTEECSFQVTYNGHVNDPRFEKCHEDLCPIYFWVSKLAERN